MRKVFAAKARNEIKITIRKIIPEEREIALRLLKESALWLKERGIDYWQVYIDLPPDLWNWLKRGFDNDEFYLAFNGEKKIIDCFRLQDKDPMFWGERCEKAGYVHSFAVSRNLAERKAGYDILAEIESQCRNKGKELLRLDCGTHQKRLGAYYEGFGFRSAGDVHLMGEDLTLYEKTIDRI